MKRDIIFLSCIGTLFAILIVGTFSGAQKEESIIENRALEKFPEFSLENLLNNSYQHDLEIALTDQIIFSEDLKMLYNNRKNDNLRIIASALKGLEGSDQSSSNEGPKFEIDLMPKGDGYFQLDDSGHIVIPNKALTDASALFESKTSNYNTLVESYPELSYYCYYIETDVDIDFINGNINHELVNNFFEGLDPSISKGALYINNPDDYKNYFYKTDHHWSSKGQIKGYEDIIHLVKGDGEELLDIEIEQIEGAKYYGSKSRTLSDFTISDDFSVLTSDLPEHKVFINDIEKLYGTKNSYIEGDFSREKGVNHYSVASGGDHGLVEYRFNQPEEDNILVFIESFSDPIKEFIASHFNNTYFVDLRYYENAYGHEFDFGDFIEEKEIDSVLFSGYYFFYANDQFLIKD